MTTWYIAGPMTGLPDFNYPAFHRVEAWIRENYPHDVVLNPATGFDGDTTLPRETYLRAAFASVLRADRIYLLDYWRNSKGACAEVIVAYETGCEFWHQGSVRACPTPALDYKKAARRLWKMLK